jgi:asparagine N-glycosylation enzyme membrane subunit Stt3
MQGASLSTPSTRDLERILAVIGTAICLIVCILIWRVFSAQQPMWPLPDLYLAEMLAACLLGIWCIWNSGTGRSLLRGYLVWLVVGVLFAFVIMGAWSVGFLFLPVAGLFAVTAVLSDRRQHEKLVFHLGAGLAAAVAQASLMLFVIRLL